MTIMPVIRCTDLERAVRFYTTVLSFAPASAEGLGADMANGVADLICEGAAIQLSRHAGDGCFGSACRLWVESVDDWYERLKVRGLDTTRYPDSPVHTAPVDQTWGLREFCVRDPDGNNLCFCQAIR